MLNSFSHQSAERGNKSFLEVKIKLLKTQQNNKSEDLISKFPCCSPILSGVSEQLICLRYIHSENLKAAKMNYIYLEKDVQHDSYCKASRPTGTLSTAAEMMIGLSKSSLHQLSPLSHKCLFLCYFSLDSQPHITFHVDESKLSLPSGDLRTDSIMRAAFCKPIVWHCTVSWSCRLSPWNCQVMKKFHTGCFSVWRHFFCSYLSGNKIHSSHSSTHALAFSKWFCRQPVHSM